jgi:hypothetical protein
MLGPSPERPRCAIGSAQHMLLHYSHLVVRRPGGHCEGQYTRSHPELGRENPQRRWYSVLRRGRVGHRQVFQQPTTHPNPQCKPLTAGWSSPVARQAHNLKVRGSNPLPATILPNTHPIQIAARQLNGEARNSGSASARAESFATAG